MTEPKPKLAVVPADAHDLNDLWIDAGLADGITDEVAHRIPFGKPRDFFRLHPDPAYRRKAEMYRNKTEDAIDEEYFLFAESMRGSLMEAAPYTLVVCIYRDGTPRIWPLRLPRDGERDNEAWVSARAAAKVSLTKWVKLFWKGRGFVTRDAQPGYAPDPAWEKLPPFNELMIKAVGEQNIIRNSSHPMYRNLIGDKPMGGTDGGDMG